jgi:predicted ArsR family transcriptional regulator
VADPVIRRRATPGRPQYVFALTPRALRTDNTSELTSRLLAVIKTSSTPQTVNVIFEEVANHFAADAPGVVPGESLPARLDRTVAFLNQHGYVARWEPASEGYLLHTCNCPYDPLAASHAELCTMDLTLVGRLLGSVPVRVCRVVDGGETCAYLVREEDHAAVAGEVIR